MVESAETKSPQREGGITERNKILRTQIWDGDTSILNLEGPTSKYQETAVTLECILHPLFKFIQFTTIQHVCIYMYMYILVYILIYVYIFTYCVLLLLCLINSLTNDVNILNVSSTRFVKGNSKFSTWNNHEMYTAGLGQVLLNRFDDNSNSKSINTTF